MALINKVAIILVIYFVYFLGIYFSSYFLYNVFIPQQKHILRIYRNKYDHDGLLTYSLFFALLLIILVHYNLLNKFFRK